MKTKNIIYTLIVGVILSCSEIPPNTVDFLDVENPTLTESSIVGQPNSSTIWLEGLERQMSNALNEVLILAELGSDNYINTQTFFSQFLDKLEIRTDDPDIRDTSLGISRLRAMAEFGLNSVGPNDTQYTSQTQAEYHFFLGMSQLYSAMYFSFLPQEEGGVSVSASDNYNRAIASFDEAIALNSKPEYHLAKARANYYLGNRAAAVTAASDALALDADFLRSAKFDELNEPSNTFEDALYERGTFDDLQPLPTLDFLDPKYSFVSPNVDASVHFLKAEEAHLILAEANLASGNLIAAQNNLQNLLTLIDTREVRNIDDSIEGRPDVSANATFFPKRPDQDTDIVNGRSGLVINRQSGNVNIPSVSGTSLTIADINAMANNDAALSLLYRTRQEVFIAEGLRFVDMGVKLVIHQNEFLQNPNISDGDPGTTPVIPSFINAVKDNLDAITYDATTGIATTAIDLNQILVTNKSSSEVLPFH